MACQRGLQDPPVLTRAPVLSLRFFVPLLKFQTPQPSPAHFFCVAASVVGLPPTRDGCYTADDRESGFLSFHRSPRSARARRLVRYWRRVRPHSILQGGQLANRFSVNFGFLGGALLSYGRVLLSLWPIVLARRSAIFKSPGARAPVHRHSAADACVFVRARSPAYL